MVWTPPMTAVNGDAFTAAEYNTHIADNLREMMPAQAIDPALSHSAGGGPRWFVTDGRNRVRPRGWVQQYVSSAETIASTSYNNIFTPGPTITNIRTSGAMIVIMNVMLGNTGSAFGNMFASFQVLAAADNSEFLAPDDTRAVYIASDGLAEDNNTLTGSFYVDGLTPNAAYSVTMKYKTENVNGRALQRRLTIVEL